MEALKSNSPAARATAATQAEGSDNDSLENVESNQSEDSGNSLARGTAKLLTLIITVQEAAASVETILVRLCKQRGYGPGEAFQTSRTISQCTSPRANRKAG